MFGGIKNITKNPDALFIVDPKREEGAVEEARNLNIPIVALMNSDCNKTKVTYAIPGNDASRQVIALVLEEVAKAYADNLKAPEPPRE